jgi:hypothetical protein
MSEGAIPANVAIGQTLPAAVRSYVRRTKCNTNAPNTTYSPGAEIKIPIFTGTPGAFIDTEDTFLQFKLTITNTNPFIDFVSLGAAGAASLIERISIVANGTSIEQIDDYNTVYETVKYLDNRHQTEFKHYVSNIQNKDVANHINCCKFPMMDRSGAIMFHKNSNYWNEPLEQLSSTSRLIGVTQFTYNANPNAFPDNIPLASPPPLSLFFAQASHRIQDYMQYLANNKFLPVGCSSTMVPETNSGLYCHFTPTEIAQLTTSSLTRGALTATGPTLNGTSIGVASGVVAPVTENINATAYSPSTFVKSGSFTTNVVLPVFSGILGILAKKCFPSFLANDLYISIYLAAPSKAFQISMDPCRVIRGTKRDFITNNLCTGFTPSTNNTGAAQTSATGVCAFATQVLMATTAHYPNLTLIARRLKLCFQPLLGIVCATQAAAAANQSVGLLDVSDGTLFLAGDVAGTMGIQVSYNNDFDVVRRGMTSNVANNLTAALITAQQSSTDDVNNRNYALAVAASRLLQTGVGLWPQVTSYFYDANGRRQAGWDDGTLTIYKGCFLTNSSKFPQYVLPYSGYLAYYYYCSGCTRACDAADLYTNIGIIASPSQSRIPPSTIKNQYNNQGDTSIGIQFPPVSYNATNTLVNNSYLDGVLTLFSYGVNVVASPSLGLCEGSCYGTYLPSSVAQSARCFDNPSRTTVGDTALFTLQTSETPTYSIENPILYTTEIMLDDTITANILASATQGDISMMTTTYKTYQNNTVSNSTSQTISIGANLASANSIFFLFRPEDYLSTKEGFFYNSLTGVNPFASITCDETNLVVGAGVPISTTATSNMYIQNTSTSNDLFQIQLQIGQDMLPQNAMSSINEIKAEIGKMQHGLWHEDFNLYDAGAITVPSTQVSGQFNLYNAIVDGGFTTPFVPRKYLKDQTLFDMEETPLLTGDVATPRDFLHNRSVINAFIPPTSKFLLGFNLDTWSGSNHVAMSGRYLGNFNVTLQMKNLVELRKLYVTTIIQCDLRISIQAGGNIVGFK